MKLLRLLLLPLIVLGVAVALLLWMQRQGGGGASERLVLYAAAGIKAPVDDVVAAYREHVRGESGRGVEIEVQYAGSGDLLARLQTGIDADLYLAADDSFIEIARERGLVQEAVPLATMKPVVAYAKGSERRVDSLRDLLDEGWRVGIGEPGSAAIGQITRERFEALGIWEEFRESLAVTKPTVNELALDLQIGALDAAVVWDTIARQFELPFDEIPELDDSTMHVTLGVVTGSTRAPGALHFARFAAAPEHGAPIFAKHHYEPVPGDPWAERPELILFSGAINRNALGPLVESFEAREGVRVQATFNGCGILTSQMKVMADQSAESGFPDLYVACDIYYMTPVGDWFEEQRAVSGTDIVLVVPAGNPRNLRTLADLGRPGVRVVLGHPTHCTIGALTDRLLREEGHYDQVDPNVVERTTSSALLVPAVATGAADATLAYKTDTFAEADRLEVIPVDSRFARAVQPFGLSRETRYPQLTRRFYEHLARGSEQYEEFGFSWLIGESLDQFEVTAPPAAREE